MMDRLNCIKFYWLALVFIIQFMPLAGQRLFYCDSMLVGDTYVGHCTIYYDFLVARDTFEVDIETDNNVALRIWNKSWGIFAKASNGLLHGPAYIIYETTGDTIFQLNYANGMLDGPCYQYNEQGDTIGSVTYQNGLKEGKEWHIKYPGIYTCRFYKNGLTHGPFYMRRMENGSYSVYGNLRNGQLNGVYFHQHKNGVLRHMVLYENNKVVDGEYYLFDWNGQAEEKLTFLNGEVIKRITYPLEDDEGGK